MRTEEVYIDPNSLNDQKLDEHIEALRKECMNAEKKDCYETACTTIPILNIAVSVKNSRSSEKLAKASILLAMMAIGVAIAGVFISFSWNT